MSDRNLRSKSSKGLPKSKPKAASTSKKSQRKVNQTIPPVPVLPSNPFSETECMVQPQSLSSGQLILLRQVQLSDAMELFMDMDYSRYHNQSQIEKPVFYYDGTEFVRSNLTDRANMMREIIASGQDNYQTRLAEFFIPYKGEAYPLLPCGNLQVSNPQLLQKFKTLIGKHRPSQAGDCCPSCTNTDTGEHECGPTCPCRIMKADGSVIVECTHGGCCFNNYFQQGRLPILSLGQQSLQMKGQGKGKSQKNKLIQTMAVKTFEDIPKGCIVAPFIGSLEEPPHHTSIARRCELDTEKRIVIDPVPFGGIARFVNNTRNEPNVKLGYVVSCDQEMPVLIATKHIHKLSYLSVDFGERKKKVGDEEYEKLWEDRMAPTRMDAGSLSFFHLNRTYMESNRSIPGSGFHNPNGLICWMIMNRFFADIPVMEHVMFMHPDGTSDLIQAYRKYFRQVRGVTTPPRGQVRGLNGVPLMTQIFRTKAMREGGFIDTNWAYDSDDESFPTMEQLEDRRVKNAAHPMCLTPDYDVEQRVREHLEEEQDCCDMARVFSDQFGEELRQFAEDATDPRSPAKERLNAYKNGVCTRLIERRTCTFCHHSSTTKSKKAFVQEVKLPRFENSEVLNLELFEALEARMFVNLDAARECDNCHRKSPVLITQELEAGEMIYLNALRQQIQQGQGLVPNQNNVIAPFVHKVNGKKFRLKGAIQYDGGQSASNIATTTKPKPKSKAKAKNKPKSRKVEDDSKSKTVDDESKSKTVEGATTRGHYTGYLFDHYNRQGERWYRFDNADVFPASGGEVQACTKLTQFLYIPEEQGVFGDNHQPGTIDPIKFQAPEKPRHKPVFTQKDHSIDPLLLHYGLGSPTNWKFDPKDGWIIDWALQAWVPGIVLWKRGKIEFVWLQSDGLIHLSLRRFRTQEQLDTKNDPGFPFGFLEGREGNEDNLFWYEIDQKKTVSKMALQYLKTTIKKKFATLRNTPWGKDDILGELFDGINTSSIELRQTPKTPKQRAVFFNRMARRPSSPKLLTPVTRKEDRLKATPIRSHKEERQQDIRMWSPEPVPPPVIEPDPTAIDLNEAQRTAFLRFEEENREQFKNEQLDRRILEYLTKMELRALKINGSNEVTITKTDFSSWGDQDSWENKIISVRSALSDKTKRFVFVYHLIDTRPEALREILAFLASIPLAKTFRYVQNPQQSDYPRLLFVVLKHSLYFWDKLDTRKALREAINSKVKEEIPEWQMLPQSDFNVRMTKLIKGESTLKRKEGFGKIFNELDPHRSDAGMQYFRRRFENLYPEIVEAVDPIHRGNGQQPPSPHPCNQLPKFPVAPLTKAIRDRLLKCDKEKKAKPVKKDELEKKYVILKEFLAEWQVHGTPIRLKNMKPNSFSEWASGVDWEKKLKTVRNDLFSMPPRQLVYETMKNNETHLRIWMEIIKDFDSSSSDKRDDVKPCDFQRLLAVIGDNPKKMFEMMARTRLNLGLAEDTSDRDYAAARRNFFIQRVARLVRNVPEWEMLGNNLIRRLKNLLNKTYESAFRKRRDGLNDAFALIGDFEPDFFNRMHNFLNETDPFQQQQNQ